MHDAHNRAHKVINLSLFVRHLRGDFKGALYMILNYYNIGSWCLCYVYLFFNHVIIKFTEILLDRFILVISAADAQPGFINILR